MYKRSDNYENAHDCLISILRAIVLPSLFIILGLSARRIGVYIYINGYASFGAMIVD